MIAWLSIIVPSIFVGIICSYTLQVKWGMILSGLIPWTGLLIFLLYMEYCVPYQGGGASMWPIAQLFGGTIAAGVGIGSYSLFKFLIIKK